MAEKRVGWIDVARGLALIFVYLGHWVTPRMAPFAYAFHLQLFFVLSGFFADNVQNLPFFEVLKKKFLSIGIPLFLWAWISFVIQRFDAETFLFSELKTLVVAPNSVQPNYWFLPVLFSVSVIYYGAQRICKNKLFWVIAFWIIHLLLGENPLIPQKYNIFMLVSELPGVEIVNAWFSISGIPQYMVWYAFGSFIYKYVHKNDALGIAATFVSSLLFLGKITEIPGISSILAHTLLAENYRMLTTLCICCSIIYISMLLESSAFLSAVGRNGMSMVGLEYITHSYIPLEILPMLNLGIPSLTTTIHVITLVLCTVYINLIIAKKIDKYAPALNGKLRNHKPPKEQVCYPDTMKTP